MITAGERVLGAIRATMDICPAEITSAVQVHYWITRFVNPDYSGSLSGRLFSVISKFAEVLFFALSRYSAGVKPVAILKLR